MKGNMGQMNTEEFSELLKTLLNDVHNRVVEQYSKAEAIADGTTIPLEARSENNTLPISRQTSSDAGAFTPDAEQAKADPKLPSVENDIGRCVTVPDAQPRVSALMHFNTLRSGNTVFNDVMGRYGRWVFNPESTIMQYWLGINIWALAFVALVSPVQVALMETQLGAMFVVNCVVDSVFIVDMVLNFFTMYHVKTDYGHRLEHRQSRIARHYLQTWFPVDLISVIPFDLLAFFLQANDVKKAKGVKVFRLLRLLKMIRMLKVSRIFKRLDVSLLVTNAYQVFDLYKFILFLVLISHWLACLWGLTLSLVEEGSVRWIDTFEELEVGIEEKTKDSIWKLYIAALYFTVYTMTSVGYGDVTPVNILERIVCVLILFISGLVWACVIGEVTSIVGNLDKQEQEFRSLMDNLNRMMKDRALPTPVRKRLRTFFLSARQAQRAEQQEQLLRRLSPVLQGEVALMSNWNWVSKVSFIYNLVPEARAADVTRAPHFVVDFALALGSAVFAQSEVFGEPRVLYILRQGLALSRAQTTWWKVFCVGDVWGEDFVLSKSSLREFEERLAVTYVEIFQLTFANFRSLCQRHSSNLVLLKRLRKFIARLSARRAILLEARLRRSAITGEAKPWAHRQDSTEFLMP